MVWFKRTLTGIDSNMDDSKAGIFTDKLDGKVRVKKKQGKNSGSRCGSPLLRSLSADTRSEPI